jgi:hypothetical protein
LLLRGHDVANSIGSQFAKTFTGEPMGKATHYYLIGVVLGLFGAFLIFWKQKKFLIPRHFLRPFAAIDQE